MAKKLLVVESNLAIQKLLEQNLSRENFEVTCMSDGLSALDLLDQVAPNLILADYNLEGISINRFCEKIKQKSPTQERPILLLVSAGDNINTNELLSLGVVGFIKKPLELKELLEKLKDLSEETATIIDRVPSAAPASETPSAPKSQTAPEATGSLSSDAAETLEIEQLLGWSLPGERGAHPPAQSPAPEPQEDPPTIIHHEAAPAHAEPVSPPGQSAAAMEDLDMTAVAAPSTPPPAQKPEPHDPSVKPPEPSGTPPAPVEGTPEQTVTNETLEAAFPQLYAAPETLETGAESPGTAPAPSAGIPVTPEATEEVVKKISKDIIEKVAWEVVPKLAEILIKEELERLKSDKPT